MINEDLALKIQQGEKSLIPTLWNNVKDIVYFISDKIYRGNKFACDKAGCDINDIRQVAYFGFLAAIRAYKENTEYMFNSYLTYHIKKAVFRSAKIYYKNSMPLNDSLTFETPLSEDNSQKITLKDSIPDVNTERAFECIELADEARLVHEAVNLLPEREKQVIQDLYFKESNMIILSKELNISSERVRQIEHEAIIHLRKSPVLFMLYKEQCIHEKFRSICRHYSDPELFDLFDIYRDKIARLEKKHYIKIIYELRSYNKTLCEKEATKIVTFFAEVLSSNN